MPSSYNANSAADRESIAAYWAGEQPSSADLAATAKPKPSGAKDNPFGENSHNSNDPKPKKDGADNTPLKDGSKSPFPHKPSK